MNINVDRLRDLINNRPVIQMPDVHDILAAKLASAAGFEALYVGSFGYSACGFGRPDQSLITVESLIEQSRRVVDVVDLPIALDLEEGGGNAVTTYHNVRAAEAAGVAAIQIEDQVPGKEFGQGGDLYSLQVATDKIKAASDARSDALIIGRTQALAIGRDANEAMDRAVAFSDAGADLMTIAGLPEESVAQAKSRAGVPMAQFVFGQSLAQLEASEIKIAIYPGHSTMVQFEAVSNWLAHLKEDGKSFSDDDDIKSRYGTIIEFLGGKENAALARKYGVL